ncbi:MAG: M28 family peptidase, partial [Hymenobacteraceae bacterium]|nr:M28 family peptidase [Hymenobacteraceae bacterium]
DYFIFMDSPPISDDHAYVNAWGGVRMIDIIEYDPIGTDFFSDYHHTHRDNMDIIDRKTLKAVGQTVLHVVYQE